MREKKPPINISDLKGEEADAKAKAQAEAGALSYVTQRGRRPTGRALDINWTQVLVSCVISLVLCATMLLVAIQNLGV